MSRTLFTSRAGGDLKLSSNREKLRRSIALNSLYFMRQTHSDLVMIAEENDGDFDCDALVTTTPGVGLAALAADCMPITLSAGAIVGVAHVGRLGLGTGIAIKTVELMRTLGASDIVATIGPSICGNCYEVSPEMYQEFIKLIPESSTSNFKHCLNLQRGVRSQLEALDVSTIDVAICTLENPLYFSHRRGGEAGRQAGVISI